MTGLPDLGSTLDKDAVREVLLKLTRSAQGQDRWFSPGLLGIEQATNRICSLQRPPTDLELAALTVGCPYCGRTPGNRCHRAGEPRRAHPSRIARVFTP